MTIQNTTIYTPFADGRPVRDIVEHTPALVTETWCRSLLRHTLDSLEQQYASGAAHRPITPETLVMLENGESLLMPSGGDSSDATAAPSLAGDLHALALVVHYAITAELPPDGPLGPRLYENYSEQLTKGLDSCLGPNRRLRPQSVPDMRTLLGIEAGATAAPAAPVPDAAEPAIVVSYGTPREAAPAPVEREEPACVPDLAPAARIDHPEPVAPAEPVNLRELAAGGMLRRPANAQAQMAGTAPPAPAAERASPSAAARQDSVEPAPAAPRKPSAAIPVSAPRSAAPVRNNAGGKAQRWGMIAGAAIVVLAAGSALISYMNQNQARDPAPIGVPPAERAATGLDAGETVVALPTGVAATDQPAGTQPAQGPLDATTGAAPELGLPATGMAPPPPNQVTGNPNATVVNGTTYKLVIKPWGIVYVDGLDHGVSPPVKRLTLAPGQHTIRITNPNFPEHTMTVDAGARESAIIEHDFTARVQ